MVLNNLTTMDLITQKNQMISEIQMYCSSLMEGVEYEFDYPFETDDMKNLVYAFRIEFNNRLESLDIWLSTGNFKNGHYVPTTLTDLSLSELEDVYSRIALNHFCEN